MRKHTKEFKSSISTFGRELDSKITVLGTELILEKEDLFSITPITNSTLLKTVMKEVDFESKKQIGIGQEVNIKSGVKVNGKYEYIDYGNYSVYKSEYKAETDTYSHICYDKMLKTMIDYTPLDITYPINLREYINAIATKCGLEFADKNSTFANYNTSINEDHFSNGNYTFRDVLDYIAQLVGGWLCINDNDELEIRYPKLAKNYDKVSGENVSFISNVEDEINTIIVDGKSTQATRSGKNIFNKSITPIIASGGQTITKLDTGVKISCTNSSSSNVVKQATYKLIDLTNYVGKVVRIKCDFSKSNENLAPRYCIGLCDVDGYNRKQKSVSTTSGKTVSFTVPTLDSTSIYLCVWLYCTYNSPIEKGDYVDFTDIIITMDNEDMTYEPYGVSPSPDYPSEIECVKDTIQVKDVGKNLFDISKVITNWNTSINSGIRNNNDGTLTISSPPTSTTSIGLVPNTLKDYCPNLQVGDVVYLNATTTGTNKYIYLDVSVSLWSFGTKRTISQNDLDSKVYWYASGVNTTATISDIMISTDGGEYEPYQENILNIDLQGNELCSLPNNVKDELVIENGIAKIIKRIGKVVLDGSEDNLSDFGTYCFKLSNFPNGYDENQNVIHQMYCNYFISQKQSDVFNGVAQGIGTLGATTNALYISKPKNITTVAQFKEWLSTHNVEVYYALLTPIDIEITDPTLLAQLNALEQITQYKHTYITITGDDLTPEADFTYINNVVINNTDSVLGKDTYWNDEVPTQQDLPSNAQEGEIRIVQDTEDIYIYNGTKWVPFDKNSEVDLSNYLTKDNTTPWVPTGPFNPSTKKYVDDSVGGIHVPTKTSQLQNDSGFVIKATNELTNYYTKNNTYTKNEVDALVAGGSGTNLNNVLDGNAIGSARTIGANDSEGQPLGEYAWAEGKDTRASGNRSHAEGYGTIALESASHAEGVGAIASGFVSHAEGNGTKASSDYSHAEGNLTEASGQISHAEGIRTTASGSNSHAEGDSTIASGDSSHAEGLETKAQGNNQHVQGKYNISDTTSAHIVGNGSSISNKSNAHTLDWSGNAWFAGDVYTGSTSGTNKDAGSKVLATKEYVDSKTSALQGHVIENMLDVVIFKLSNLDNRSELRFFGPSNSGVKDLWLSFEDVSLTSGDKFEMSATFQTASSGCGFIITESTSVKVKLTGDDVTDGVLNPVANKVYEIAFHWNGFFMSGVVNRYI